MLKNDFRLKKTFSNARIHFGQYLTREWIHSLNSLLFIFANQIVLTFRHTRINQPSYSCSSILFSNHSILFELH